MCVCAIDKTRYRIRLIFSRPIVIHAGNANIPHYSVLMNTSWFIIHSSYFFSVTVFTYGLKVLNQNQRILKMLLYLAVRISLMHFHADWHKNGLQVFIYHYTPCWVCNYMVFKFCNVRRYFFNVF